MEKRIKRELNFFSIKLCIYMFALILVINVTVFSIAVIPDVINGYNLSTDEIKDLTFMAIGGAIILPTIYIGASPKGKLVFIEGASGLEIEFKSRNFIFKKPSQKISINYGESYKVYFAKGRGKYSDAGFKIETENEEFQFALSSFDIVLRNKLIRLFKEDLCIYQETSEDIEYYQLKNKLNFESVEAYNARKNRNKTILSIICLIAAFVIGVKGYANHKQKVEEREHRQEVIGALGDAVESGELKSALTS